jgi:hypothetical protein
MACLAVPPNNRYSGGGHSADAITHLTTVFFGGELGPIVK